jgi:hypothetical protein
LTDRGLAALKNLLFVSLAVFASVVLLTPACVAFHEWGHWRLQESYRPGSSMSVCWWNVVVKDGGCESVHDVSGLAGFVTFAPGTSSPFHQGWELLGNVPFFLVTFSALMIDLSEVARVIRVLREESQDV